MLWLITDSVLTAVQWTMDKEKQPEGGGGDCAFVLRRPLQVLEVQVRSPAEALDGEAHAKKKGVQARAPGSAVGSAGA
jgi:hypothetical protein